MKRYLIIKLLAINLSVIGFVMIVMWLSIDTLAADYFAHLMEEYNISPQTTHDMFVGAVHRYLIWASFAAVILAIVLSYVMMRRVLAPLTKMTVITREIASGKFDDRVPVSTKDEIGQLAMAFNSMAENLEKIENLRRTLMIDVAHELRTPMTNIRGYLEALNDSVIPPSAKIFSLLHDETLRLAQLVEDVLQLARADAASGNLDLNPTDLGILVKSSMETFLSGFSRKGIKVNFHEPKDQVTVPVDQKRITRVLRNLTENAVQYTPQNGKIDILLEANSKQVRIDYINNLGELIPEDLPYLFERFYRGEKSRSREHGGAGIGLAIVKELVEAHGGTVGTEIIDGRIRIWFSLPMNPLLRTE